MNASAYRPNHFVSLVKSCYDGDFYEQLPRLPFARAIVFLFLLSLLIAVSALVILAFFWSRLFPTQDAFLSDFDANFPKASLLYAEHQLTTDPSEILLFVGFDETARLRLLNEKPNNPSFRLQINTNLTLEEALETPPHAFGVYAYHDGFYLASDYQNQSFIYADFELDQQLSANKQLIGLLLKNGFPLAQEWLKNLFLITGPLLIFFYHFVGAWVLALLFSVYGIVMLLIMQKKVRFFFLLKLSFYASVPSLVIALATAFLGISIAYIPLLVYLAYYSYGLFVYEN